MRKQCSRITVEYIKADRFDDLTIPKQTPPKQLLFILKRIIVIGANVEVAKPAISGGKSNLLLNQLHTGFQTHLLGANAEVDAARATITRACFIMVDKCEMKMNCC